MFSAGLDYGFKHDQMGIVIVSTQRNIYETVDVIAEWRIDNQAHFSHQELAFGIVNWFKYQAELRESPELKQGLWVYCDKSNPTYIEMLNSTAKQERLHWIWFRPSPQEEVQIRIAFKQWLISSFKLNISLEAPALYHELKVATWDLKAPKPRLAVGSLDHMMDAFDYATITWYRKLMKGFNPYWLSKEVNLSRIIAKTSEGDAQ
jgi:hypothetical protein